MWAPHVSIRLQYRGVFEDLPKCVSHYDPSEFHPSMCRSKPTKATGPRGEGYSSGNMWKLSSFHRRSCISPLKSSAWSLLNLLRPFDVSEGGILAKKNKTYIRWIWIDICPGSSKQSLCSLFVLTDSFPSISLVKAFVRTTGPWTTTAQTFSDLSPWRNLQKCADTAGWYSCGPCVFCKPCCYCFRLSNGSLADKQQPMNIKQECTQSDTAQLSSVFPLFNRDKPNWA